MPVNHGRLLIVDDEVELTRALCDTLAEHGFETIGATSSADALETLCNRDFDLLLSDLTMPGIDGIEVLRRSLEIDPTLIGIIMTGQGTVPSAVEAMKAGAFDYVLKPFNLQTMLPTLSRAMDVHRLRMENVRLRHYVERLTYESPRYRLVGSSIAIQRIIQIISKVALVNTTVLVRGPSGSGKELVARALHHNSKRRGCPLVTVNCAALQQSLVESELFGHERGAFTGADHAKPGLLEVAEGGTLFIDEIAEISPAIQAKLLRVLEDGSYRRVGGIHDAHANVRIIAATNKVLSDEMQANRFREDLFYRLNVVSIDLPPLRDRREDISPLVEHFLRTRQLGKIPCRVHPDAMHALEIYGWPGNVRELANVLERAQILAEDNLITMDDLPDTLQLATHPNERDQAASLNLHLAERRLVKEALRQSNGNKVRAAHALGVTRRSLYRLITKHHLDDATH